jgi:phospholipid/cholesterol/gamma-HCH transport system substrate-binding protein
MASGAANTWLGAKVAVFAGACVALIVVGYRIVGKSSSGGGSYTVYAHLNDASGLVARSRIKIAGISVGTIDSIVLDNGKAKVALKIDKNVELRIDATVAKKSSSLLGEYQMVLTPGTEGLPRLPDGGEVMAAPETPSTDKILTDVATIAEKVKEISIQAASAFGTEESGKQMKEILKNLASVSKEINETVKENRAAVRESLKSIERITVQGAPKVDQILKNVEDVTGDVKSLLEAGKDGKIAPGSAMADARDTLRHLDDASIRLDSTLEHSDSVMGRIDRGQGTIGRLTTDSTLIDELEGVASDVREFTSGITRLQTIISLRADYLIRSNGIKTFTELRLQPREDKYYMVELIADTRGQTAVTQTDTTTTNPNEPVFSRTTTSVTTNSFLFSFMFARRFGPATFLFGIRESSGGASVNLHAFEDRLELRSDIFGFGQNVEPKWRETLLFEFVKRLWITVGVDDILNPDKRDYWVGGMLRFNDEDLKSILPFTPKF